MKYVVEENQGDITICFCWESCLVVLERDEDITHASDIATTRTVSFCEIAERCNITPDTVGRRGSIQDRHAIGTVLTSTGSGGVGSISEKLLQICLSLGENLLVLLLALCFLLGEGFIVLPLPFAPGTIIDEAKSWLCLS